MDFIPVNEPLFQGREKELLLECIETGWISSEGPFVREFEERFAARVGRKHGIAVCNGSAAIDAAVHALGLKAGDEVILPTFTIISCAASIVRAGATPVVVDCNPDDWNMNLAQVEACITPRTRAIMVVHIYGLPCDMEPLLALARSYGLLILEDAAQMHGQNYRDRPCGSFGEISTFSFYPNKHITTGEGGMVVTDDPQLAEKCRLARNLYFQERQRYVHDELGWNFRMTNLQAAIGLAQLEQVDGFIERKRAMGKAYTEKLKNVPGLQLPKPRADYAENIYWVYGIVLEDPAFPDAKEVAAHLAREGIGTRPFFWPIHKQPVFQRMGLFGSQTYPVAEHISIRGLYLPSGLALTPEQIDRTVFTLKQVLQSV
ncbi:MAG: DegT/DnrJ/EryC1/StrS family aminotransferase [Spirochaetales bacterium]|nr:DegT/DnrJ/EryC1/StrS family aminotransferase [Spirochaetales bacterium]